MKPQQPQACKRALYFKQHGAAGIARRAHTIGHPEVPRSKRGAATFFTASRLLTSPPLWRRPSDCRSSLFPHAPLLSSIQQQTHKILIILFPIFVIRHSWQERVLRIQNRVVQLRLRPPRAILTSTQGVVPPIARHTLHQPLGVQYEFLRRAEVSAPRAQGSCERCVGGIRSGEGRKEDARVGWCVPYR